MFISLLSIISSIVLDVSLTTMQMFVLVVWWQVNRFHCAVHGEDLHQVSSKTHNQ